MNNPPNYPNLAKTLQKIVRQNALGTPPDIGELLAEAVKKHIGAEQEQTKLSVGIGLSDHDAIEFIRNVNMFKARDFLKKLDVEQYGANSKHLIYVLLKEGDNIATRDKAIAEEYYASGEYLLVEVTLLD